MTAPVPAAFGTNLHHHRTTRRWSLHRAANAAGVSVMTVTRAETGHSVGLKYALALAAAYGTTLDALVDQEPPS